MYPEIIYEGIGGVAVTMQLDSATITSLGEELASAKGKTVTLTANDTAGFGSEGGVLFGVINHVEKDGVANINIGGFAIGVKISSTAAKQPTFGGGVAVDGSGGVVKADAAAVSVFGLAVGVDTATKTATILLK